MLEPSLLHTLQRLLAQTSLTPSETQLEQLVVYVQLMHKWNKAYNLTSVRDPQQMLATHIVDSLVVSPYLQGQRFIDVGTGPGLPGIPLAIINSDKHFTLLDSLGKRVRFMTQVGFELKLDNIQPLQSRVERYQPSQKFDGVLSRAFASLKDMLHWCQHLVDSEGCFLALKGQLPQEELAQLPDNICLQQVIDLQVPGIEGQRHLIKLTKRGHLN